MKASRPITKAEQDRFWSRAEGRGESGRCWLWTGAKTSTRGRYGAFYAGGKMCYAHRLAFELTNGSIPDGMVICHQCDVPLCVNPAHLFLGTQAVNLQDMREKGRHYSDVCPERAAKGEQNGRAKLTREQVDLLRFRFSDENITIRRLAAEFGIDETQAGRIVRGQAWK